MKKTIFALLIVCGLFSCNKETKPLSKEEVKLKIDSAVKASTQQSDEQAQKDLGHRIRIEVKVKADSIVNSRYQKANTDSSKIKNQAVQPSAPAAIKPPFTK